MFHLYITYPSASGQLVTERIESTVDAWQAVQNYNSTAWEDDFENLEKLLPFITNDQGRIVAHAHYSDKGRRITWLMVDSCYVSSWQYRPHGDLYVADACSSFGSVS